MSCPTGHGALLVRVHPGAGAALLDPPRVGVVMRGRAMAGWLDVSPEVVADEGSLRRWVDLGVAYAETLPPPD